MKGRFVRSAEDIAIVRESIAEDPNVLIPRRSQELGTAHYGVFCVWIYIYSHIKSGTCNNCRQLTIHSVVKTWKECLNDRR